MSKRQYRQLLTDSHPEGSRQFHNQYPGLSDDPGSWRGPGARHPWFNFWVENERISNEQRCHCGCFEGLIPRGGEHYSTGGYVDENGVCRGGRPPRRRTPDWYRWVRKAARAAVAARLETDDVIH